MGHVSLDHLLARPEAAWLLARLGAEYGVTDHEGSLVAGRCRDGAGEPVHCSGRLVCHAHGPHATELAGMLTALAGSEADRAKVSGEHEFRELTLALASELQLEPLLGKIMDAVTRILDADRSTLFLHDSATNELYSPVAQGMGGRELRIPSDTGIAGTVFSTGRPISIDDARADERFNPAMDLATGYRTNTILCCPVVNKQGVSIGAVQALNKRGGPFTRRDAERLTAFAAQASLAIENAQLYTNLEEKVEERTRDLHEALDTLSGELEKAAGYVKRLIPGPLEQDGLSARGLFVPSAALGGDAFGYHWLDEDRFAVYLTDVSGHGVGAALLSVSITNVLWAHALPGVDFGQPGQVLEGLNRTFPMQQHGGMFFTIWYGVYSRSAGELVYCSGGHPPALLLGGSGEPRLMTRNPVMGVVDKPYQVERCAVGPGQRLVVYSDGCYEILKSDGSMWTLDEFLDYLLDQEPGLEELHSLACSLGKSRELDDDFSILEVCFG